MDILKQKNYIGQMVVRLITSYFFGILVYTARLDKKFFALSAITPKNALIFAIAALFAFILLSTADLLASKKTNTYKIDCAALVGVMFAYAVMLVNGYDNIYFVLAAMLVIFFCTLFVTYTAGFNIENIKLPKSLVPSVFVIGGVLMFAFIAALTTLNYLSYYSANFDFGIFVQMFYNMKKSFLPMTTSERGYLLSHFAVHISPIYYLILPFYYIFPYAITLQIAQALIVASGIIPVYKLCKRFNLSRVDTVAMGIIYAFLPAMSGGSSFDIHENCFLAPMILWVLYFMEIDNPIGLFVSSLLTFAIKEDASIYIIFVSMYMIFYKKKIKRGAILCGVAFIYFLITVSILNNYGTGIMDNRYVNYRLSGEEGLITVIKNIFFNPAYVFKEAFTVEKLEFLLKMLLPFAFIPFFTKKVSSLWLIAPMFLVNLMPGYVYAYDMGFQYIFASSAFLVFLTIRNLSSLEKKLRGLIVPVAVSGAVLVFASLLLGRLDAMYVTYNSTKELTQTATAQLEEIPKDAVVLADAFILPHIADRDEIYETKRTDVYGDNFRVQADYLALDMRYSKADIPTYETQGYEIFSQSKFCTVMKHKDAK